MFKLLIECSKDIDTLSINFSDGTSVVTESSNKEKAPHEQREHLKTQKELTSIKESRAPRKKLEEYLDTAMDFSISQEVVQKPIIQEVNRPANVSEELQNLDL